MTYSLMQTTRRLNAAELLTYLAATDEKGQRKYDFQPIDSTQITPENQDVLAAQARIMGTAPLIFRFEQTGVPIMSSSIAQGERFQYRLFTAICTEYTCAAALLNLKFASYYKGGWIQLPVGVYISSLFYADVNGDHDPDFLLKLSDGGALLVTSGFDTFSPVAQHAPFLKALC